MKAFLLAAGYGTRLRPITDTTPKCMVPIQGKPLLAWWIELFKKYNITEVLINTHYLSEFVRDYICKYNQTHITPRLVETYEGTLLGSGGTVLANRSFVRGEESFFICYADNLTNANLVKLAEYHAMNDGVLTMGLFRTNNPRGAGIASIDPMGKIIDFVEKPECPASDLANAGLYVTGQDVFNYIPCEGVSDFGKDVLPRLLGKMYGIEIEEYIRDIGTMENYKLAQEEWKI